MEGVSENYKGVDCLDTIKAFDEYGLQYWLDVRAGNTHTSVGAPEIIHRIFSNMPKTKKYKQMTKYVRADSGYCNEAFFNACETKDIKFVTSMRANMFNPLLKNIRRWKEVKKNGSEVIRFYDGRECEIGQTTYKSNGINKPLRVLIIRAKRKTEPGMLIKENEYDHYAWITNLDEHEMGKEELIIFYRKRGQAENYIKDMKYAFDLKHYPCQKLLANKAYGLICAFAYTLMRFIALRSANGKVHYTKRIRNKFINLPSQVVRHARQVIFKYNEHHYREVQKFLNQIHTYRIGFT